MIDMKKNDSILEIRDLHISFPVRGKRILMIRGVDLCLPAGKTLAIVGESGSGKSVTVRAVMSLLPESARIESGSILLKGRTPEEAPVDLSTLPHDRIVRDVNGKRIAMVFQDPMTILNPTMTVGKQIAEGIRLHQKASPEEAKERTLALLGAVGIEDGARRFRQYPHELSGGLRQRIVIAIALTGDPDILICDEPTTALDVTIQARILSLIRSIQKERRLAVIYITHDLGVVAQVADDVAVMYAGRIVEEGTVEDIFIRPAHPYTWGLLSSLPDMKRGHEPLTSIPGNPPDLSLGVRGDPFAPRNPYALPEDFTEEPPMIALSETHRVRSRLYEEGRERPRYCSVPSHALAAGVRPGTFGMAASAGGFGTEDFLRRAHMNHPESPVLEVSHLKLSFGKGKKEIHALEDVSFTIFPGEIYALVGESGSGKTTVARAVTRILTPEEGTIRLCGREITGKMSRKEATALTEKVQLIFQDPMSSLNPSRKILDIIAKGPDVHRLFRSKEERRERVLEIMEEVGLSKEYADRYPRSLSGGQRQRVAVARALIMNPELLIADEPTSALDVSIRAQIINLLLEIRLKRGFAILFITHDLALVRVLSDRVGVMARGRIVETGSTEELFAHPDHPYTRSLIEAIPLPVVDAGGGAVTRND